MKYQKWIEKNTTTLENKTCLFVGATGSIGKVACEYLLYLKCKLIIAARNIKKANILKDELLMKYPNNYIFVEEVDQSSLDSIDQFRMNLNKYDKIDILINNAGVYHLPLSFSKDGFEIHYATNTIGNYYLTMKVKDLLSLDSTVVNVGSLSYTFSKINYEDPNNLLVKNKTKKYGITKRMMTLNSNNFKRQNENINVNIVHPGICATELFTKSHSKLFLKTIYPIMKSIFHSKELAALSILQGVFAKTTIKQWIGPRFFGIWGKPKKSRLKRAVYNVKEMNNVEILMKTALKNR